MGGGSSTSENHEIGQKIARLFILRLLHSLSELNAFSDAHVDWCFNRCLQEIQNKDEDEDEKGDGRGKGVAVFARVVSVDLDDLHNGMDKLSKNEINHDDVDTFARIYANRDKRTAVTKNFRESQGIFVLFDFVKNYDRYFWNQYVIMCAGFALGCALYSNHAGVAYIPVHEFLAHAAGFDSLVWLVMEILLLIHTFYQRLCFCDTLTPRDFVEGVVIRQFYSFALSLLWFLCWTVYWTTPDHFAAVHFGLVRIVLWRLVPWLVNVLLISRKCSTPRDQNRRGCCYRKHQPLRVSNSNALSRQTLLIPGQAAFWLVCSIMQILMIGVLLSLVVLPLSTDKLCREQCYELRGAPSSMASELSIIPPSQCAACYAGVVLAWLMTCVFAYATSSLLFYPLLSIVACSNLTNKNAIAPFSTLTISNAKRLVIQRNFKFVFTEDKAMSIWTESIEDYHKRHWITGEECDMLKKVFSEEESTPEIAMPRMVSARRALSFFIWSVSHMADNNRKARTYGRISQLLPTYGEKVSLKTEDLRGDAPEWGVGRRFTPIDILAKERSFEWKILAQELSLDLATVQASLNQPIMHELWTSLIVDPGLLLHSVFLHADVLRSRGADDNGSADQLYAALDRIEASVAAWASRRVQTVSRTVLGVCETHRAHKLLFAADDTCNQIELIIGAQAYGNYPNKKETRKEVQDLITLREQIFELLAKDQVKTCDVSVVFPWEYKPNYVDNVHPNLLEEYRKDIRAVEACIRELVVIDEKKDSYDGKLLKSIGFKFYTIRAKISSNKLGKVYLKFENVVPRLFPTMIGSGANKTPGKPSNHALIQRFVSGHVIQMLDANMDFTFSEGCKQQFGAGELFFDSMNQDQVDSKATQEIVNDENGLNLNNIQNPTDSQRGSRYAYLVGFPELIYTMNNGASGRAVAVADSVFASSTHRVLHDPLEVRLHYGHPDFMCSSMLFLGLVSVGSASINLSEDVIQGMKIKMRRARTVFVEYLICWKGRETSFLTFSGFLQKISSGAFALQRSRDTGTFGVMDEVNVNGFRYMSHFQGGPGWYAYHMLIGFTVMLYPLIFLIFKLGAVSVADLGYSQSVLGASWLVDIGMIALVPMIVKRFEDLGAAGCFHKAMFWDIISSSVFFLFQNQQVGYYFLQSALTGRAAYVKTGRPQYWLPSSQQKIMKMYFYSHYVPAVRLLVCYVLYLSLSEYADFVPMFFTLGTAGTYLIAPILFQPAPHARDWKWISAEAHDAASYVLRRKQNEADNALSFTHTQHEELMENSRHVILTFTWFGLALLKTMLSWLIMPAVCTDQFMAMMLYVMSVHVVLVFVYFAGVKWLYLAELLWPLIFFVIPLMSWLFTFGLAELSDVGPDYALGGILGVFFLEFLFHGATLVCRLIHNCSCVPAQEEETTFVKCKKCRRRMNLLQHLTLVFHVDYYIAVFVLLVQFAAQVAWFFVITVVSQCVGRLRSNSGDLKLRGAHISDEIQISPVAVSEHYG